MIDAAAAPAFDVLVIGGGINGAGIARDAAGRGLRVLLCERDDLAAHTSSASTKLVHGGLRYLEHREFMLVRKALMEREVLLEAAPHIIWPLRFVMPHDAHLRPRWMIRAGLFLYDHLARRRRLPGSAAVDLRQHAAGAPLDPRYTRGFVYSDAWVEDARLVVLNAMDAADRGATVRTRTAFVGAHRDAGAWHATLQPADGAPIEVRARALVNAAGPWVGGVLDAVLQRESSRQVRLVKGSHIIVPRLFEHEFAYIFQNPDRRIIFAIPYERDFTLIGTTDLEYRGDPACVAIDGDETAYLCEMADRYFRRPIAPGEVVATYSGVRPLLDDESADPSSVTRDYSLEFDDSGPPLLSVFGGKITTFRRLAEEAVDRLAPALGAAARPWTSGAPLPGGDMPDADFGRFEASLATAYPWLPAALRHRYARAYGTRVARLIGAATSLADLGAALAPGLYEAEVAYLRRHEFARTAQDILWRRSKLSLHLPPGATAKLDAWLAAHPA
jgi:glycerol-3-phosphate dehydrogenase